MEGVSLAVLHQVIIPLYPFDEQRHSGKAQAVCCKQGWMNWAEPPETKACLLYTSPSPRDGLLSRMPSSA